MRFEVECYENPDAFSSGAFYRKGDEARDAFHAAPLGRVVLLLVEAETSEGACDVAFEIGNSPGGSGSADLRGTRWDHSTFRSMSVGDVVVVRTPDGPVAYGCLPAGWLRLDRTPDALNA